MTSKKQLIWKFLTKSTQIFENYEKNKEKIFFDFWIFKDEREKYKNDPKYENFGSNT